MAGSFLNEPAIGLVVKHGGDFVYRQGRQVARRAERSLLCDQAGPRRLTPPVGKSATCLMGQRHIPHFPHILLPLARIQQVVHQGLDLA